LKKADSVIQRPVSYGYRVGEVDLVEPGPIKTATTVSIDMTETRRKVVAVSLGPHILGAARPKADRDDPVTKLGGAMKRVMKQLPRRERNLLMKFDRFVRKQLPKMFDKLPPHTDVSFETWINNCKYPLAHKNKLKKVYADNVENYNNTYVKSVKGFPKDESYEVYKHLRWIMSRTDEFKCMYGPWVKCIENEVYKHPSFIKHIPTLERGNYITELLGTKGPFYETDYTAYESQFDNQMMRILEFNLYNYMTTEIPGNEDFMRMNFGALGKCNDIKSKNMKFTVEARMSGEMSTSLGNGFSNLMTMLFVAKLNGNANVKGVVEGDDGLFTFDGPAPQPDDFSKIGFHIKLQKHTIINECSFCGIVFDEIDQIVVTDPRKVMLTVPWTTRQYLHSSDLTLAALLRCKGMSLRAQYPGAPIIQSIANYAIRVTNHVSRRKLRATVAKLQVSSWERERMFLQLEQKTTPTIVGARTRILIANRYGITVNQQLAVETIYDNKNDLLPIRPPNYNLFNPDQNHYYDNFVVPYPHLEGSYDTLSVDQDQVFKLLCDYSNQGEMETTDTFFYNMDWLY
jgi:hypothetical protein